jgi:hypothetical protein
MVISVRQRWPRLPGLDPLRGALVPRHTVARLHQVAPLGFSLPGFYRPPTWAPLQGLSSRVLGLQRPVWFRNRYALHFRVSIGQRTGSEACAATALTTPQPS